MIHPQAVVDERCEVHPDASIGPFCFVDRDAVLGSGVRLGPNVRIGQGVEVGDRTVIEAGAFLEAGTMIGADVLIGPSVSFVDADFARSRSHQQMPPTIVLDGASIGSNVTVFGGVTIGRSSVIGANAVVTRDVPPFATVVGSPARIIGYQSSPRYAATKHLRASTLADSDFPLSIGRATVMKTPLVVDLRGSLTFGEVPGALPFEAKRYFMVFDVQSREIRGEHAHKKLHQLLICGHGECSVAVDDGEERGEVVLDRRDVSLHLPPMVWATQYQFSSDGVLLVLASDRYDADDYIRTYSEFAERSGAADRAGRGTDTRRA